MVSLGPFQGVPMQLLASARPNEGMVTDLDSTDISNESFQDLKNTRVRLDKTSRRLGTVLWTPTKPDSNKVLLIAVWKKNDGTKFIIRFTPTTINRRGVGTWTLLTTGTALTGGANDRFQAVTIIDEFCFTNGVDRIYKLNTGASTYDVIASAPKAKYITGFSNRLIAANYNVDGGNPAAGADIGWSGDKNITVFDPLVDPSAGRSPLLESTSDLGDFITGVFGDKNVMIVLREQSIWLATKNPSASNPFNFQAVVPGLGCNAPYTAKVVPGGLVFYDAKSGAVWIYPVGGSPERISFGKVEKEISRGITDPNLLFSSFAAKNLEFELCAPVTGSTLVKKWIYGLTTKAWSYDEVDNLTSISDPDYAAPQLAIDDLQGTIDQLVGTIDSLVAASIVTTSHLIGKSDGTILEEDKDATTDNGVSFTTDFVSKDYKLPVVSANVAQMRFEYECEKAGTLTLSYSVDKGKSYKTAKSVTMKIGSRQLLLFSKNIRARQIRWKLSSSNGLWSLLDYEIHYYPGGVIKPNDK